MLNALKTCTQTHTVTLEHRLTSTAFRWVLEEDLSSPVLTAALSGGEEGFLQLLFWLMLLMRYSVLSKWSNLYFPWVLLSWYVAALFHQFICLQLHSLPHWAWSRLLSVIHHWLPSTDLTSFHVPFMLHDFLLCSITPPLTAMCLTTNFIPIKKKKIHF